MGRPGLVLRNVEGRDVGVRLGVVAEIGAAGTLAAESAVDVAGLAVLPGLVNAHDHLDFSTFPPLGRPPYRSLYEWSADVNAGEGDPAARAAMAVPLVDRLFLGGLRNLLAGATAVAHHGPFHRSLSREDFPVRVLAKYEFAHSPGLTPRLRKTYRTTDRRIPWMVHVAEGTDERCAGELQRLREENVLRQNTVMAHGIALRAEDMPGIAAADACVVWCPQSNRHLYGATADVRALRAAGVRVGLGSDSPASGVRDALSNLAAARAEGVLTDDELLEMATGGSAEVARLPLGALEAGAAADFVGVDSRAELLSGDRRSVRLVVSRGRALYAAASFAPVKGTTPIRVDGEDRLLDAEVARRTARILREHPKLPRAGWLAGLELAPA